MGGGRGGLLFNFPKMSLIYVLHSKVLVRVVYRDRREVLPKISQLVKSCMQEEKKKNQTTEYQMANTVFLIFPHSF